MVWTYFRLLDQAVHHCLAAEADRDKKDAAVLAVLLAVTTVEAFVNSYFQLCANEQGDAETIALVTDGLAPENGAAPLGLKAKLNQWPPKILGRSLAWQSGVAAEFERLRLRRNSLMHFTSTYESLALDQLEIRGLTDTSTYDSLDDRYSITARSVALGMLAEIFRLSGVSDSEMLHRIHSWTGVAPQRAAELIRADG